MYSLQLDNKMFFAEVKELREKIERNVINEECFRNNDEKVKYFTGLQTGSSVDCCSVCRAISCYTLSLYT